MTFTFNRAAFAALLSLLVACAPAAVEPSVQLPSVKVQTLVMEDAELRVALPGRVVSTTEAQVRPQVDGVIARILFKEGSPVSKGQPLYQLDDATLRARHEDARARLRYAQAACNVARQQAIRLTGLARVQGVSQHELERAIAAHQQADADVGMARAALEVARIALAHTRIAAPISGRISRSSVTVGTLVTAHQAQVMATIDGLDPVYIDVVQSAAQWLRLRADLAAGRLSDNRALPVDIQLEDGSMLPTPGRVTFSDDRVDAATGTQGARIRVPNPDGVVLPGMYVKAWLGAGLRRNAVLVPMQAVVRDATGRTSALVVDAQGVVAVRAVRLGHALGERWLVEEGLHAGDRVVMEGQHKLQSGARIAPAEMTDERPAAVMHASQEVR